MKLHRLTLACLFFYPILTFSQEAILHYSVNGLGQVQIEVASTSDSYYVLQVAHLPGGPYHSVSMAMGQDGSTVLTEALAAYPQDHYRVIRHPLSIPFDSDGDGRNDVDEFGTGVNAAPFNSADPLDPGDAATWLPDLAAFEAYAVPGDSSLGLPELAGLKVLKFGLLDKDSEYPRLYFIHPHFATHTDFATFIGAAGDPSGMTGLLVYYPNLVAANGRLGTYRFNFQPQNLHPFPYVQKVAEMLAANMPFLENNLCYYPFAGTSLPLYQQELAQYDSSRVCVLLDEDIYGNVAYLPFHLAEGYGLLRHMTNVNETPHARDIVLYESLPNSLPRVGGIITTVTQTPLSHVNLRAIQDDVPNAFIREAHLQPQIAALIGRQVYYRADADTFILRAATVAEVEAFYASQRPAHALVPVRDLSQTQILPLDSIGFHESSSFGVKCANVATMRSFGFPDGTIPDGFGIPFYFYDEFMKFNDFYTQVHAMINDPAFRADYAVREQMLAGLRDRIKAAPMPGWMSDALGQMQASFPAGTSIRCRSSTNNEDLPGFSGAGLYDSRTQHPQEGHISKSIRQVYASMWNYRAFEEREFYRVDHFLAAMGVLVHPHFEGELANGVGVSIDPFYQSLGTYYLNTQIGEDLVTNPGSLSVPEEILLNAAPGSQGFALMQRSNLVPVDSMVMNPFQLDLMRDYLSVIHDRFAELYGAMAGDGFAMEIEYKITASGALAIKQARPWASYWSSLEPPQPANGNFISVFPNPFSEVIRIGAEKTTVLDIHIYNVQGQVLHRSVENYYGMPVEISAGEWAPGAYFVEVRDREYGSRVVKVVLKQAE